MASRNLTAQDGEVWLLESPIEMVEGEVAVFRITFPWINTLSSPATTAFIDGESASSTLGGSDSASGNVFTSKTFTPSVNVRGDYVLNFQYVNGSNTEIKKLLVRVSLQED